MIITTTATTIIEEDKIVIKIPVDAEVISHFKEIISLPVIKIENNELVVEIPIIKENQPVPYVGVLVPIVIPGEYEVHAGDIVKITFGYPLYPASRIRNIKTSISDPNLAALAGVLNLPPEKLFGVGALSAFIVTKNAGTVHIKATPVDDSGNDILSRVLDANLKII